jgi:hypothetical protein
MSVIFMIVTEKPAAGLYPPGSDSDSKFPRTGRYRVAADIG